MARITVLIPLNSGLAWSATTREEYVMLSVLIPLNSGLAWSPLRKSFSKFVQSLNPFEFRAGLEPAITTEFINKHAVLIPLNSGLAWSNLGGANLLGANLS